MELPCPTRNPLLTLGALSASGGLKTPSTATRWKACTSTPTRSPTPTSTSRAASTPTSSWRGVPRSLFPPGDGVLRNLVGARSGESLDDAEGRVIDIRKNVEGAEVFLSPKCRSPGA